MLDVLPSGRLQGQVIDDLIKHEGFMDLLARAAVWKYRDGGKSFMRMSVSQGIPTNSVHRWQATLCDAKDCVLVSSATDATPRLRGTSLAIKYSPTQVLLSRSRGRPEVAQILHGLDDHPATGTRNEILLLTAGDLDVVWLTAQARSRCFDGSGCR